MLIFNLIFSFFIQSWILSYTIVLSIFKVTLPTSSDPIYRFACRYVQRFISMVTLNPIKLTIRIKYNACHSNIIYLNEMIIYLKRMAFYSPCMLFSWDFIENMKYERKLAVHHGSFSKLFLLTSTLYSLIKKLHSQLLAKDPCAQSTFLSCVLMACSVNFCFRHHSLRKDAPCELSWQSI